MGPDPAVAAVRLAVRRALAAIGPGERVLAGCSGGADSLALVAALAAEAPALGLLPGALVVDHRLQPGSTERSKALAELLRGRGLDPVELLTVRVEGAGGPEDAARRARYAALDEAADRHQATVLLGHTRDDQAETVLLGLARGSGARSLSAMSAQGGRYLRPLLGLDRAQTRAACRAEGLEPWDDPQNADPAFTRARVRHAVLPLLERELGPGVAAALARTARLLRADADALDGWAERAGAAVRTGNGLDVNGLLELPAAVRSRVLRAAAVAAGSPPGELGAVHVEALDALLTAWHGQGPLHLPGRVRAVRACDRLLLAPQDDQ